MYRDYFHSTYTEYTHYYYCLCLYNANKLCVIMYSDYFIYSPLCRALVTTCICWLPWQHLMALQLSTSNYPTPPLPLFINPSATLILEPLQSKWNPNDRSRAKYAAASLSEPLISDDTCVYTLGKSRLLVIFVVVAIPAGIISELTSLLIVETNCTSASTVERYFKT